MELILSARSKAGESTDYTGLEKHGLSASVQLTGGTGGPKEPFLATVTWNPDNEGVFYQYGGYSCSLSKGTVGYTLGYDFFPLLD
jgi:hypothetical protein